MHCILLSLTLKQSDGSLLVVRLTDSPFDIVYQGHEYQASGDLLSVGDYETTYDLTTQGVEIQLSGVDPSYLRVINEESAFLKAPLDILIAEVPEGSNVATSAAYYHRGFADTPNSEFDDDDGSVTLGLETESVFGDLERKPEIVSASYANHSSLHKGDTFFLFTANAGYEDETWGV